MTVDNADANGAPRRLLRRRRVAMASIAGAVGAVVGAGAALAMSPGDDTAASGPTPSASPSPTAAATPSAQPTPVASSPSIDGDPDARYPSAEPLDAATLARVGDLWRVEAVSPYEDDPVAGPTVVYLVSPTGTRYRAGSLPSAGWRVVSWDVEGDSVLLSPQTGFAALDLATGEFSGANPPFEFAPRGARALGVGSDSAWYWAIPNASITDVWSWTAEGWNPVPLAHPTSEYSVFDGESIPPGGDWLLYFDWTMGYPGTAYLYDIRDGSDAALPLPSESCTALGWATVDSVRVRCWDEGSSSTMHVDAETGLATEVSDWGVHDDDFVYASAQLSGTPLIFRFDDRPGFVSSIGVLAKDGVHTIADVASEDQFLVGDVVEVRRGTYVIHDGVGYTPGNEIVRAVIDVVSGFAAFGSPSDPYWEGELPAMEKSFLVNFEGESD